MKRIFIESDLSSFADFHDHDWQIELFNLAGESEIAEAVDRFAAHWWGAARTFILPSLLVDSVYSALERATESFPSKQELWEDYLEISAFKGALWKTAENAYSSIYYAYENLLVSLINLGEETPMRVTDRAFNSIVLKRYGDSLAGKIWNHKNISLAREIRNCLVHRGGEASPKLKRMRTLPGLIGRDIVVSASNARSLYHDLKPRAILLVAHHAQLSSK